MKRDPLLWAALVAVLVVLASAEYELAVACGFGTYVAAGVPAALDVYAIASLRARRDVFLVVVALVAVNAASHLVAVGLLPVSVVLVVSVSAIAPLVLWRVHHLSDHPEPATEPALTVSSAPAEPAPEPVPPTGTGAADIETVDSSNTTFAARVATVRNWLETEPELTGTEIGTRLGVSDGYGRRLLRTARDGS
ncbi:hypothetical protein [Streptomyces sp. NPDC002276]